ncbi:MAG: acetate--CoA ligase family protein [Deltaproteobacteria bacterium]|jgi:acetyltransferase|nr:acetate--CoA ligase family protein [Deltaproteobacteria bacterium]
MSIENLDKLFLPKSVAVVGASNRPESVGSVIMKNLLEGGYQGQIIPVNPKGEMIHNLQSIKDIPSLESAPDLAVLAIPPAAVPLTIQQLCEKGTRAVIIISAGLNTTDSQTGLNYQAQALATARKYGMRIVGPNCLGLLVPRIGLNASFSACPALEGKIAFISQSGALAVSVLDWAMTNSVGFSHLISIGDAADLSFPDILEYLSNDPDINAIFMYIESVHNRSAFMRATLLASKKKPLFAIKSGRVAEGAAAAASHTGALAGGDDVYDAAFERAGVMRLEDLEDMYAAVQFLAYTQKVKNENLTIITNGGGPGVLAVDGLIKAGGHLTKLSQATIDKLNSILPATWSHANPVDIIGDAPGERYAQALKILYTAPEVGDILVMYVPTGITSGLEVAEKVLATEVKEKSGRIFGCWVGGNIVWPGIKLWSKVGLPCFDSGEKGVKAFMSVVKSQDLLAARNTLDVAQPELKTVKKIEAQAIIDQVITEGRSTLTEYEAKEVFALYNIPVVQTKIARTPVEAESLAQGMRAPIVVKILSNDITHKSDAGGVVLNLKTPAEVKLAAEEMLDKISKNFPHAKLDGWTVQEMVIKPNPHEIIIGITTDPIFGPALMIGQGGTAVEVIKDSAIALPPLNLAQALAVLSKTRVYSLLKGYRDRPAAKIDEILQVMLQVAKMVIDLEEIVELDVNPLLVDELSAIAVDARIIVKPRQIDKPRLAIV